MELTYQELNENTRLMKLTGKLDIAGSAAIEGKFAGHASGDKLNVLVDLSGVDFLSSMGIRLLVVTAKAVTGRGGKFLLVAPSIKVRDVLVITGIDKAVPMFDDLDSALASLS